MLESTFQDLGKHEDTLWRSVANREMTVAFFKKYRLAQVGYRTLDVGCGAGATVKFFNSEYQAYGMDNSLVALSLSRQRGLRKIFFGDMRNFPVRSDSFDFISAIDVIEHILQKDEDVYMRNIAVSLEMDGVLIVGTPTIESQLYPSPRSKEGHVNCKDHQALRTLMERYFQNVFIFSMNDEVVHTGFYPMAHYLFAIGAGKR